MSTVVMSGAGTGIGAAAARRLGQLGWNVALVGLREAFLQEAAGAVAENGGRSIMIGRVPERTVTLDAFSAIDALINNAATILTGPVIPLDGRQTLDIA